MVIEVVERVVRVVVVEVGGRDESALQRNANDPLSEVSYYDPRLSKRRAIAVKAHMQDGKTSWTDRNRQDMEAPWLLLGGWASYVKVMHFIWDSGARTGVSQGTRHKGSARTDDWN